jgi:ribosomal protein L7Ae-like RNA K-turn-binding protein
MAARTSTPPADEGVLRLLGLGYRAGTVLIGVDAVRAGLQQDRFACVVVARDASPRANEKVVRLAAAKGILLVAGPPAEAIGARLGMAAVMVAGVQDRALAQGIAKAAPAGAPREA